MPATDLDNPARFDDAVGDMLTEVCDNLEATLSPLANDDFPGWRVSPTDPEAAAFEVMSHGHDNVLVVVDVSRSNSGSP